MKRILLISSFIVTYTIVSAQNIKLWYDKPAIDWQSQALPIGNAYLAAMVYGGIDTEHIQVNEETLWEGGPGSCPEYNFGLRQNAWKHLTDVRNLLSQNKINDAHKLANKELTGVIHIIDTVGGWMTDFGAYQNLGDIYIKVANQGKVSNYYRDLNLSNASANVHYTAGGVEHKRCYFASYPKRILVFRIENSSAKGCDYELTAAIPQQNVEQTLNGNILTIRGNVKHNLMQFESRMKIETDGNLSFNNQRLSIKGAKKIIIYFSAATDYQNAYPSYRGRDYKALNNSTFTAITHLSYEKIKKEQLSDYQKLFNRVYLNLGNSGTQAQKPTDFRFAEYAKGAVDPEFEVLYFQFARYLTISATRPGSMPLYLQGKWNNSNLPPWTCDVHTNINEQMLYWPCEVTNLAECQLPLVQYIKSLQIPGQLAAREHFGCQGWIVNTMNNVFGYNAPGWEFPWGFYPAGAAWLCQHLWEHYSFSGDTSYLRSVIPTLRNAALFWHEYLTTDEHNKLVSSPSYSPEHGGISKGAMMDHEIIWDLFTNYLEGAKILDINDTFTQFIRSDLNQLCPLKIGKWGQLQEWKEDVDDSTDRHRHVSHLFALHPGRQISYEKTPDLANAAKHSLIARGDDGTGWSIAWKISFWARLLDGDHAYKMLRRILKPVSEKNGAEEGGSYSNLLCSCPPFQMDGNMGSCAGIAEMLLQSQTGAIQLLPALPSVWKNGSVKGLCARGGFVIDIEWKNGALQKAVIYSKTNTICKIRYSNVLQSITVKKGESIVLDGNLK
jgi:alpha-L-fucosidase 2